MEGRLTRRGLLSAGAGAAVVAVAGPKLISDALGGGGAPRRRRVIVVGAGLAGLTAAYELGRAGFDVTVLEARARFGGRVYTVREPFLGGQHAEAGGEYIDAVHRHVRAYCRRFGLPLENTARGFGGLKDIVYRDRRRERLGRFISGRVARDVNRYYRVLAMLGRGLDPRDPVGTKPHLDSRSARSVLDRLDASRRGLFILESYIRNDYAAEPEDLSLLTLVTGEKVYERVPERAIEAFRVRGGNSRLTRAFANRLSGQLRLSAPVTAIAQSDSGVEVHAAGVVHEAEFCVLAAPLHTLRAVDLTAARLPSALRGGIANLAYGRATKTLLQYERRYWRLEGFSGDVVSDRPIGATWEATDQQPGRRGVMIAYSAGADSRHVEPQSPSRRAREAERLIGQIFRDPAHHAIETASVSWPTERYTRGAWMAPGPGQVVPYWRALREPAGRIHLAGEHTDDLYPGYMEGAVRSGRRAARTVNHAS